MNSKVSKFYHVNRNQAELAKFCWPILPKLHDFFPNKIIHPLNTLTLKFLFFILEYLNYIFRIF